MTPDDGPSLIAGPAGAAVVAVYLIVLVVIGLLGKRATRGSSLSEFFLAGRGLGPVVLLLTLFATQYSGNTLVGMAGQTYRVGYPFVVAVPFFVALIGVAMVVAPALHRLGQRGSYITLADAIQDRLQSRPLSTLVAVLGVWALANFLITNLVAIGLLVEVSSQGAVGRAPAIVGLALVMIVYETLGGLRAVAWTDVVQGLLIVVGTLAILTAVLSIYGGAGAAYERLSETAPSLLEPPSLEGKVTWVSTLLLVSIGASLYPHAVQRYYAARDAVTLRRSLSWMVLVPFLVTSFVVLIGIVGRARFPELTRAQTDQITILILTDLAAQSPLIRPVIILFLTAVIAAIMSTVDSLLLALAATFTQDLYRPMRGDGVSESHLTRFGKIASWIIMLVAVGFALWLDESVWRLLEIKLEVLIQTAPAVWLALYGRRPDATALVVGLLVGVAIALSPVASQLLSTLTGGYVISDKWHGVHVGVLGLVANAAVVAILTRPMPAKVGDRVAPRP